ncbi:MAG: hypothetical protein LQ351_003446 [Letrouitia transgressa]|nr:MAG: hypothetical protein LQ351_003446 [Letrouitia transgressa]
MRGFEWKDQRGVEGTGFVRALRSLMTPQLPLLLPTLKQTLEDEFNFQISASKRSDALQYPQDVYVAAELLRIMPGFLAPSMAALATRNHRASKTMHRYLAPIIQGRLSCRDKEGPDKPTSTFAIEDLCLHSGCMSPLRKEQEQMFDDLDILNVNKLPLLDSFIKESSRLSTSDANLQTEALSKKAETLRSSLIRTLDG